jgi:hypothetical protein
MCTLDHTAHIEAIVQFLPHSDQHVKCDVSTATVILFFKSGMLAGLRMRTKLEHLLFFFHLGNLLLHAFAKP